MIYFKMLIRVDENLVKTEEKSIETEDTLLGKKMNRLFERTYSKPLPVSAYVTDMENKNMKIVLSKISEERMESVKQEIQNKVEEFLSVPITIKAVEEITAEEFCMEISDAHSKGYIKNSTSIVEKLKISYDNNPAFTVKEDVVPRKKMSKKVALKKALELMADEEYMNEMERIYCKENVKEFYCHPVHYYIKVSNEESARMMTDLLITALNNNGRLLSGRVSRVLRLENYCCEEEDFDNLICNSQGATVVLSVNAEGERGTKIATGYEDVEDYFAKLVYKYHNNILFIFQEITNSSTFGEELLSKINEKIRIIELSEGGGKKEQAEAMLKRMIMSSEYADLIGLDAKLKLPEQDSYTQSDIQQYFDNWIETMIYEKAYKAYGLKTQMINKEEKGKESAYAELREMVGLADIKSLVNQMVAMNKIQKKRRELGLHRRDSALHMIFTGNPGSAKTTVARLIGKILYEEGIIQKQNIVECGRSDLVGKFVGWTAKQVKRKFHEAKDGVLFIDEAYSLVDDRNGSFGDEAINTIVQEMENHRNDVIVILAGYPEKMKLFLEKNEGLKSRIAYHLDFPNYSKKELVDILKLMINRHGYSCEKAVFDKCERIFEKALLQKDFGNGRYVSNLLEHAIMNQSIRLMEEYADSEIDKEQINYLLAEDFEEIKQMRATSELSIGFHCA